KSFSLCASESLWLIPFQLLFHEDKEVLNRLVNSSLQRIAQPRFAHQPDAGMKIPRAFTAQLNLLRNVDRSQAVVLFELQRITQEILSFVRRGRPLDRVRVRRSFAYRKRKAHVTYGRFGGDRPAHDAAGFATNALNAAEQLSEILEVREELSRLAQR